MANFPSRGIISINTSDSGGGAEQFARLMHTMHEKKGIAARLLVGEKHSRDETIIPFWGSSSFDYRPFQRPLFNRFRSLRRSIERRLGIDDFLHPYSHFPTEVAGLEPSVLHLHNLHGGYFDLRALPELSRRYPTVWTLHDYWAFSGHCAYSLDCARWQSGCGQCPDLKRAPGIERDATRFNFARKRALFAKTRLYVTAASQALLDKIPGSMIEPMVIESRKIPYGIDLTVFHPGDKMTARKRLGLPLDTPLILFAAHDAALNPYKDFATIRKAMQHLQERGGCRPVELIVLGAEPNAASFEGLSVHPVTFVRSREAVADYYRAADIYVHGAKDEVFGIVLLEAMACGTPLVATAVGGIPQVFDDGVEGILVPPHDAKAMADASLHLISSMPQRTQLGEAGIEKARRYYDINRCHSDYLSWFEEIANGEVATKPVIASPLGDAR